MANPQPNDPHLRVAHSIIEAIMLRNFTKRQLKIILFILRMSWGCGKKSAYIPRKRDFEYIGIAETHINLELKRLVEYEIVNIEGSEYVFNKDYDQWKISTVKDYSPKKLSELVGINLRQIYQFDRTENSELTKTVSKNLPEKEMKTYQNGKLVNHDLVSAKENNKEIYITSPSTSIGDNEFAEFFQGLRGWEYEEEDLQWISDFIEEYPEFNLSMAHGCRDYHSGLPWPKRKATWKIRFRNWCENGRRFAQERAEQAEQERLEREKEEESDQ